MESRIPLPTDNIFKFYALFGLLLFVFGAGALIYVTKSTNAFMAEALVELETLKSHPEPTATEQARRTVLERQVEIEKSDKTTFTRASNILIVIATSFMGYGFWKWHTAVQRIQDRIVRLQLEKLELEVEAMKRTAEPEKMEKGEIASAVSAA